MRRLLLYIAVASTVLTASAARAETETDRLREALRKATVDVRAFEDRHATLQAKLTAAEQERDRLRKQNETFRAQVKEAEQAYRQAVKEFNDRLTERDESLEKWKSAYAEAATVARSKDAERTRFASEAASLKASGKACVARNAELVKVGGEIVRRYEEMNPIEKLWDHEPVTGLKRVEHQNAAQDYREKILDQKVNP